jgi:hypothetical protein
VRARVRRLEVQDFGRQRGRDVQGLQGGHRAHERHRQGHGRRWSLGRRRLRLPQACLGSSSTKLAPIACSACRSQRTRVSLFCRSPVCAPPARLRARCLAVHAGRLHTSVMMITVMPEAQDVDVKINVRIGQPAALPTPSLTRPRVSRTATCASTRTEAAALADRTSTRQTRPCVSHTSPQVGLRARPSAR